MIIIFYNYLIKINNPNLLCYFEYNYKYYVQYLYLNFKLNPLKILFLTENKYNSTINTVYFNLLDASFGLCLFNCCILYLFWPVLIFFDIF